MVGGLLKFFNYYFFYILLAGTPVKIMNIIHI